MRGLKSVIAWNGIIATRLMSLGTPENSARSRRICRTVTVETETHRGVSTARPRSHGVSRLIVRQQTRLTTIMKIALTTVILSFWTQLPYTNATIPMAAPQIPEITPLALSLS